MVSFKAREIVKILQKLGYIQKRQTGSHLIMYNPKVKRVKEGFGKRNNQTSTVNRSRIPQA